MSILLVLLLPGFKVFAAQKCELLDQIILKFHNEANLGKLPLDTAWWHDFSIKHQLPIESVKPMVSGAYLIVVDTPKFVKLSKAKHLSKNGYFNEILKNLLQDPNVKYADRDMTHCLPPPPVRSKTSSSKQGSNTLISHASQWNLFNYPGVFLESGPGFVDGAWSITFGFVNPPIVFSNFEEINYNSALAPNILTGWNFHTHNTDTTNPADDHGTHTAGTIAATGMIAGITGIGPQFKILPIVSGSLSELEQSIYWSMGVDIPGVPHNDYPIKVASMSFVYEEMLGCPPSLQEAFDAFVEHNGVITVSAGNGDEPATNNPPRACNNVIVVAATSNNGTRASYSNYGPRVTLAAPGGDRDGVDPCDPTGILSTVSNGAGCQNSGFSFLDGTSMATPHVAGIAGLIFAINPFLSSDAVKSFLLGGVLPFASTSDPEASCLGVKSCGAGIVNAFNSTQLALSGRNIVLAPSQAALQLKHALDPFNQCPANLYVPTAQSIESSLPSRWILHKPTRACQPLSVYETPILQVNDRELVAIYGKTVLTLQTQGLSCQVNYPYGFIC